MIFEQIPVGHMQNFSYIIGDELSKEAAVVDPAWEVDKILKIAKKHDLDIKKILITHTDFDHIEGVKKLFGVTGAAIYVHKNGKESIQAMGLGIIELVDEGSLVKVGKINISVLYMPGHNSSHVCYLIGNDMLITGDVLFVEGCGRIDLPTSDIKNQFQSLQRIKAMDDNIEIYPGHDYGSAPHSTIRQEKESNPYLKFRNFEEFAGFR